MKGVVFLGDRKLEPEERRKLDENILIIRTPLPVVPPSKE